MHSYLTLRHSRSTNTLSIQRPFRRSLNRPDFGRVRVLVDQLNSKVTMVLTALTSGESACRMAKKPNQTRT